MNFDWVEPLPNGITLLDAKLEDGRLRLEVEGALTTRDKKAVARRFAGFGDVEVIPRYRQPRRCLGCTERDPRRLQLRYATVGGEHIENVMIAEDAGRVILFGVMCVPEVQDIDQQADETLCHVYLREPLGDRPVIDGYTGEVVPSRSVSRRPHDATEEWVHT
jgi:hypothetical protein